MTINNSILLSIFFVLGLSACDSSKEASNAPTESSQKSKLTVLGVDISSATKLTITSAFSKENLSFIEKLNDWEEVWTSGSLLENATRIKVGFTEENRLAYFQYDFTNPNDRDAIVLFEASQKQYGTPSSSEGQVESGAYVATWDMGDGLRIVLKRKLPKGTTHLTYFNDPVFETLKFEYKIAAAKAVEARQKMVSSLH